MTVRSGRVYVSLDGVSRRLLFPLLHPAFEIALLAGGDGERARRHVFAHRRSRAHVGAFADGDGGDELGVGADEGAVLDDGLVLVHAVVVAGDGAAADVHFRADVGVAEVAQVIGLRSLAQTRLLGLDEVAEVHFVFQHAAGADVRPGPDLRVVTDGGFAGHAVGL